MQYRCQRRQGGLRWCRRKAKFNWFKLIKIDDRVTDHELPAGLVQQIDEFCIFIIILL